MMKLRGAGPHGPRGRSQRGSAAVEAAIVTPVVMALFFGIIEMGFFCKDYLAVAAAVRAGVRVASANPRYAGYAQAAANQVALTGGAMNLNDIQTLWIYKVDPADPSKNTPLGGFSGSGCTTCVKFSWNGTSFVSTSDTWSSVNQNACSSSGPGGPPDRIGVYITLKHNAFTGLVFKSITISEASIMSLEPISSISGCK
jgi:TadE-like protein